MPLSSVKVSGWKTPVAGGAGTGEVQPRAGGAAAWPNLLIDVLRYCGQGLAAGPLGDHAAIGRGRLQPPLLGHRVDHVGLLGCMARRWKSKMNRNRLSSRLTSSGSS